MPDPRIVEIRRLYDEADSLAREVGELRSEVQIPAINELRYAGHHALQAITDDGAVDIEVLARAKSHCQRAMYEAAEAGIMFCLDSMKDFGKTYSDLVISEVIADYPSRLARAQTALDLVVKGRSRRTSVGEHVTAYMDEFRVVRETMRVFDASRDDLNVKRAQQIREYRQFAIRALLLLLGVLVAAIGLVLRATRGAG